MTNEQLIAVIRRDIGTQIHQAIQFKMSSHLAANAKIAREASAEIEAWLDALMKDNNVGGFQDGIYAGTVDDWRSRAYNAERKIDAIKELLSK